MKTYAKIIDGAVVKYPYSLADLKADNPSTGFPETFPNHISKEDLESFDCFEIQPSQFPEIDERTEKLVEHTPEFVDGEWKQIWTKEQMSAEEIQQVYDAKAEEIRSQRNSLLLDTDWTQIEDFPYDRRPWTFYRNLLRKITEQPTFPWQVNWPNKPVEGQSLDEYRNTNSQN